jgi:AraC-like DNA-binding protein
VDPLSDVLRVVRLSGAFFYHVRARSPWSVQSVAPPELRPLVMPDAEHLMAYHIVTSGRCYAGSIGEQPVEMMPGDVIVFPRGDPHFMSSGVRGVLEGDRFGLRPARYADTVWVGDGDSVDATLVCGFFGCDRLPFNPLLASLPHMLHARGLSDGHLDAFTRLAVEESKPGRAGGASVLTRLAELMFIEVLRHHLGTQRAGQSGWLAGLADPVVANALAHLHADPARAWTLEELANEAASSRSGLADRFASLVGQPPMQYLAAWRMQVAAGLLAQGNMKVAAVASAVGYDSEAAFSRAFKKATGVAPGAWRRRKGDIRNAEGRTRRIARR